MDVTAQQIADQVNEHIKYYTALVGLIGAVIGSIAAILGNILMHVLKERSKTRKDKGAKTLLVGMLEDASHDHPNRWRRLETLSQVIGADEQTTKRLLIQVGARGDQTHGSTLWGLKKYHPLSEIHEA